MAGSSSESEESSPISNSQIQNQPHDFTQSPYYLHPSENPSSVLISLQLNNTNYHSWSRNMKRALISKNKFKFINGKLPAPEEDDPMFDYWERCTHFKLSDLLQEIHSMKQGEQSVNEFFTVKIVWDDLEALRPIPICSCNIRCSCDAFKIMHNQHDIEYAICFLKGLNDAYSTVRSQILLMKPLPSIGEVFSLIIQQENHLPGTATNHSRVMYNASERSTQGRGISHSRGRGPSNNYAGR
ncbi:hypothetical protein L195_g053274, partial [Trifolium pratense]